MAKINWICHLSISRFFIIFRQKLLVFKLLLFTLCYNVHVDKYYIADTAMEPMFWIVDHFTKFFGPIFVFIVCAMTSGAVVVVYIIGIPYWWQRNSFMLCILFIIGHWLLVNVVFHYFMAASSSPGYLPEGILIPEAVSICKKCISPKPPRTHHCSVCNRCILKMDHHCPWLNNCIGHYNHRYFFLFMFYMLLGVIFIMIFGFGLAYDHIYGEKLLGYNSTMMALVAYGNNAGQSLYDWMRDQHWYHVCVVYLIFLCLGVLIALGSLCAWHARLISRGETSIEALINRAEIKRYKKEGKAYVNPFDFGTRENWKMFLGLTDGRGWRYVLFPSTHKPKGSGLQWPTTIYCYEGMCT